MRNKSAPKTCYFIKMVPMFLLFVLLEKTKVTLKNGVGLVPRKIETVISSYVQNPNADNNPFSLIAISAKFLLISKTIIKEEFD